MNREQLMVVMPKLTPARADGWALWINDAMAKFEIDTPRRVAAFIAQVAHESSELTRLTENLRYTTQGALLRVFGGRFARAGRDPRDYLNAPDKLANFVYADRLGNGPEGSGDGWRFRGRGPIQLTGRKNYREAGAAIGWPLEDNPDLVIDPKFGMLAAAWFWHAAGCNGPADLLDLVGVTTRINGPACAGLEDRRRYWFRAQSAIPDQLVQPPQEH